VRTNYGSVESICTACGKTTLCVALDFGLGRVEAWGVTKTDEYLQAVSQCCEAPCEYEDSGRVVTLNDLEEEFRSSFY